MTAKDLLSPRVVVGTAEERLKDVAERMAAQSADHCVVLDALRRTVLGLVRLREVAARSNAGNRILADLVSPTLPLTVSSSETPAAILELVETQGIAEVVVVDTERGYVGLITAESALTWLHGQHRAARKEMEDILAERQRLNEVLDRKIEQRRNELRISIDKFQGACLSLSHDVRGPLRSIEEFARLIRLPEAGTLSPHGVECAERIERAAQKVQTLATDLLDRSRETFVGPAPQAETVDLNQIVDDVMELHQTFFSARGASIKKRAALPIVPGRYVPLLQIVSNLVSNAVRYVPEGRQPVVEIWSEVEGGEIVLFVKDNGRGIGDAGQRRIFDPFVRIEPRGRDGTGLGLSIARQAAGDIGAVIGVESAPGEGSTFTVTLGRSWSAPSGAV